MIPSHMVQMRGGVLVKAISDNMGTVRMAQTSSMMPRRPTKSCNQHNIRPQRQPPPFGMIHDATRIRILTMRHPATVMRTSAQT